MIFLHKLKENILAVAPIILIVLILHWTIAPLSTVMLGGYFLGGLLLILGLTVFLLGADVGILPMGELIGANLSTKQGFPVLLIYGAVIGFSITMAEPDLQVMAKQVASVNPEIGQQLLVTAVAVGAGLFVVFGLMRIVMGFSLKVLLLLSYALIFLLAQFTSPYFIPMGFDSGGVTTGPMTVPFIMALGVGVASVRSSGDHKGNSPDSFGLVSLMSIGPIVAVMILGVIFKRDLSQATLPTDGVYNPVNFSELAQAYATQIPHTLGEIALAMIPLALLFFVFQLFYIKLPWQKFARILIGLLYTYVGLVVFLLGAIMGFSPVGAYLGASIASSGFLWWLIPLGAVLGFSIVFAEPAVWVLTQEVEDVSAGRIAKKTMMLALASAVSVAVALGFLRSILGFSIWYYLLPGYALAFLLMPFTPNPFSGIAFDSGGVASGVMASTFILPFTFGICSSVGGNILSDAFGTVAMIALAPLIAIQGVGLLYQRKERQSDLAEAALAEYEDDVLEDDVLEDVETTESAAGAAVQVEDKPAPEDRAEDDLTAAGPSAEERSAEGPAKAEHADDKLQEEGLLTNLSEYLDTDSETTAETEVEIVASTAEQISIPGAETVEGNAHD